MELTTQIQRSYAVLIETLRDVQKRFLGIRAAHDAVASEAAAKQLLDKLRRDQQK